jgi:hypothetical protein
LDPEGSGIGKAGAAVFPIRCPECPLNTWVDGIQDDVAERILDRQGMVQWVSTLAEKRCHNTKDCPAVSSENP